MSHIHEVSVAQRVSTRLLVTISPMISGPAAMARLSAASVTNSIAGGANTVSLDIDAIAAAGTANEAPGDALSALFPDIPEASKERLAVFLTGQGPLLVPTLYPSCAPAAVQPS